MSNRIKVMDGVRYLRTQFGWKTQHQAPILWMEYEFARRKRSGTRNPKKSLRRGYAGHGRIPRDKWKKKK